MKQGMFMDSYEAYSGALMDKESINKGNKSIISCLSAFLVILPNSALQRLTKMNVQYPMFFRVTVPSTKKKTFCGVLEFVAKEGSCYIPGWVLPLNKE